ncbi:acyl-CoA carboxylase epsilon subunit [Kitasatospora sp. NPDC096077]|uniref:acyl-CoA carboxylase epsilon subunit n=1 Tax=Kitasatospora sp. NPDC096077 TaxID=3155544 RepID=UPI0033247E5D
MTDQPAPLRTERPAPLRTERTEPADRPALFRTDRTDLTPEEIAALTVLLLHRARAATTPAARPPRRTVRWHDVSLRPPVPTTSWQIVA